jgi:Ni/Co efflux regulator RcnB
MRSLVVIESLSAKGVLSMSLRKYAPAVLLAVALAGSALGTAAQDNQSPKQDMKDAGHATKDAAKDTGRATKKTAKRTGHAVKRTSKKAANKTAEKTRRGAEKVEDKTQPN